MHLSWIAKVTFSHFCKQHFGKRMQPLLLNLFNPLATGPGRSYCLFIANACVSRPGSFFQRQMTQKAFES
jgi:hypothetical protein